MISITGLTVQQVKLLDKMWSIDDTADYESWKAELPRETMNMVDTLHELVLLAELDKIDNNTVAADYLSKYQLRG